jgi:glycosyltransferase involved in cell wall biosynthesis
MVARMVPVKDHRGVLTSFGELVKSGIPISLALAGDGPLIGELRQVTIQLGLQGRVYFLGDISKVEQFLNSLDLFVLNSQSEGMSNTVLEAMACGLPVIATSVGSNSDLVSDGQTGILIPAGDSSALTRAISALAADGTLRLSMGTSGRIRIEKAFGIGRMVQAYSQLYDELRQNCASLAKMGNEGTRRNVVRELRTESIL